MSARRRRIFADDELRFLHELIRGRIDFMVVGLSAAALQGAPVVTQDVDLWFRDLDDPRLRPALRKARVSLVSATAEHPPVFVGTGAELFDIVTHMHGLESFDEERRRAVRVALGSFKLNVLPLDRIIASKRALGRPKDKLALPVLSDARLTIRAAGASGKGRLTGR